VRGRFSARLQECPARVGGGWRGFQHPRRPYLEPSEPDVLYPNTPGTLHASLPRRVGDLPGRSRDGGERRARWRAARPGSHQGCHQRDGCARRLPSVIVRVNSRERGGRPRRRSPTSAADSSSWNAAARSSDSGAGNRPSWGPGRRSASWPNCPARTVRRLSGIWSAPGSSYAGAGVAGEQTLIARVSTQRDSRWSRLPPSSGPLTAG